MDWLKNLSRLAYGDDRNVPLWRQFLAMGMFLGILYVIIMVLCVGLIVIFGR